VAREFNQKLLHSAHVELRHHMHDLPPALGSSIAGRHRSEGAGCTSMSCLPAAEVVNVMVPCGLAVKVTASPLSGRTAYLTPACRLVSRCCTAALPVISYRIEALRGTSP